MKNQAIGQYLQENYNARDYDLVYEDGNIITVNFWNEEQGQYCIFNFHFDLNGNLVNVTNDRETISSTKEKKAERVNQAKEVRQGIRDIFEIGKKDIVFQEELIEENERLSRIDREKYQALERDNQELERKNKELENKVHILASELQRCKDDIVKLTQNGIQLVEVVEEQAQALGEVEKYINFLKGSWRISDEQKAITKQLREQGLTYSQIAEKVGISKSSVANIVKGRI